MHLQRLILQSRGYGPRDFLVTDGRRRTYAQTVDDALRIAFWLRSLGVRKGDEVVYQDATTGVSIAVFYATQLLGAVFVPVNQNWTQEALQRLEPLLQPTVYVGTQGFATATRQVAPSELRVVLDHGEPVAVNTLPHVSPSDPSTVLFSSGTTGPPKGVRLCHETLYRKAELFAKAYGWHETDALLSLGDIHTIDRLRTGCLAPLFVGNRVVVLERKKLLLADIAHAIATHGCTLTGFGSSLIRQFIHGHDAVERDSLASLRFVGAPGSLVTLDEKRTFERLYGKRVLSYYGLSEAGGFCAAVLPSHPPEFDALSGVPMACTFRIVDERGHEVGQGVAGELLIASEIPWMQGYLGQPELDAHALRDGWLWTGDLASLDPQGGLRILGRMGDAFKNAYEDLVVPEEVESVLMRHELVDEAAVFSYRGPFGEARVAAVVSSHLRVVDKRALFRQLRERVAASLGTQKCPTFFELVDVFPKTDTGKIKRNAVKAMFFEDRAA